MTLRTTLCRVDVADDGAGMAPKAAARAFEPFFTTAEVGKGPGLRLSQVYGFARQSGGTASIDSRPGAGRTVSPYLPTAETEAAPFGAADMEEAPFVTDAREAFGFRVLQARDGVEALMLLRGDAPVHLLFSDVAMPNGIGGPEPARRARALRPGIRVLLTSGYRDQALAADLAAGIDLLPKPYRGAELAAAIAATFASRAPGGRAGVRTP